MRFSEKMGHRPIKTVLQVDSIDDDLRASLWNLIDRWIFSQPNFKYRQYGHGDIDEFSKILWEFYFKRPFDKRSDKVPAILAHIRNYFFSCQWYEIYDILEFFVEYLDQDGSLTVQINKILERELAGYRIINGNFIPITCDLEISEIQNVLDSSPFSGARSHIAEALNHLSNRSHPDLRNVIKEAISAVESACKELARDDKASLAEAVKILEREKPMHQALKKSLLSMYVYTSDEHGIRHAMIEDPAISIAEAKFFIISCSAFCNYLASRA